MQQPKVFFVGSELEVAHHAAPLQERLNIEIAEPAEVLVAAKPGDLAIFYSEHFDRFRDCCRQLKRRSVATLYMIDGILEWRNAWLNSPEEIACPYTMRPVLSDKVACIGPAQARALRAWGNAAKTEIVGIPRFDNFADRYPINSVPSSGEFRVLVMTAKTPGFTPEQVVTVQRSLLDIKQWAAANPQVNGRPVRVIWRLTKNLATEIGVANELSDLSGRELALTLQQVDAVVATPSTAMLEAMLLDLPVAMLDYHNCPHHLATAWTIYSIEHIGPTLIEMERREETRMFYQREQLMDGLLCQDDATDRFVRLVKEMLATAAKQLAAGTDKPMVVAKSEPTAAVSEPTAAASLADSGSAISTAAGLLSPGLVFPEQVLDVPPQVAPKFVHTSLFPELTNSLQQEQVELAVELAHSRREIQKLNRDIEQLQDELDQAHQIFEQIENHPIAGPIVRVRQKMLDLVDSIKNRKVQNESACAVPIAENETTTAETVPK